MIPLKLTLHNFICYRDPAPLDFTGLHLACLSGNNGHGKSAILDAITWALWGQARSSQADDLIHLGQSDMAVELEFALAGERYRVLRSRERRGRTGKSDLQLQIAQPDSGWRAITEPTLRDTERAIETLLRMDYATFINSAFLVQGRADEFTIKPPGQRKQILANILGLNLYDTYEARAKEQARTEKQSAALLSSQLQEIDAELVREPQYQQALEQAQAQLDQWSEQLRAAEQAQQQLRSERQDLQAQRRMLDDLGGRLRQTQQQVAELSAQLQRDEERLAADHVLLAEREHIEQQFAELQRTRQAEQNMNRQLMQQSAWQADRVALEGQIARARLELEAQQRATAEQLTRLAGEAGQLPTLTADWDNARAELARLQQLEHHQAAQRLTIQSLRDDLAALQADNKRLRAEMDDLHERIGLLESAAICPTCRQPLGDAERSRVLADYRQQGTNCGDQFRANQARINEITEQGRAAEADLAAIEDGLRQRARWQRAEAQAEQRLLAAQTAAAQVTPAQNHAVELAQRLSARAYAQDEQSALAVLEQHLATLGYDRAAHEALGTAIAGLVGFEPRHSQLQLAVNRADDLQARIAQAQSMRATLAERLAVDTAASAELTASLARLAEVERALTQQGGEVAHLERSTNEARLRLAEARQKLSACRAQAARRVTLGEELQTTLERQALYEELQLAFGKKGLQAMIIEAAIPELEAEANQLLNRMTDGQMSLRLETQRETKTSQELRETLDIILSDELGSRDYSMFSGGEAFRANFAIRIALSKLLARRSGAALQTLIVDEGFGTQDAQGRERLVQAITSIQDDFARILVITHIDELKDLFPARIEVVKTAEGSQISVN